MTGTHARGGASSIRVIIVTYNSGPELIECVESVSRSESVKITVIDNNSDRRCRDLLTQLHHRGEIDTLMLSDANEGFAKAVNRAIEATSECDVFLMNPDAVVYDGCISELARVAAEDASIGLLTPVVRADSSVRTMSAGMQPTVWRMFCHYSGLSRAFPNSDVLRGRYLFLDKHADRDRDVDWAAGCCLYIPRSTLDKVGLLSERWFMYGEDIEYCHRVLKAGLRIRLVSSATARHEMGVSVEASGGPVSKMWPQNTFDFYHQTYSRSVIDDLAWKIVFSLGLLSRAVPRFVLAPRNPAVRTRSKKLGRFAAAVWTTPSQASVNR